MYAMDISAQPTLNFGKRPEMQSRILVVEDESEIRQLIALHLRREGHEVDEAEDGEKARQLLSERSYQLIVLDWMMPVLSGLELTRWLRTRGEQAGAAVLFVTAKGEPGDVVEGLNAGADDFVTKPFDTTILMARVRALIRRQEWLSGQSQTPANVLVLGDLVMNTQTYEVKLSGQPVELTRSEFRLLETMLQNQGKVLSRETLIEQIQGEGVNVVGRTVDTHVFGLRKKLGEFSDMVETIRGVGYRVRYLPAKS